MERQLEPASNLGRRLMQRLLGRPSVATAQREARVIAVASGKGGTGKSFLATNLAVALHQTGRRVAVVDCDFGLGNAHLLLGVNPRYALHHLLSGEVDLSQAQVQTPFGPDLVAGGSGISGMAEFDERQFVMFARCLGAVARDHDVVILDCAAGLSTQTVLTMLGAEHVVLVTNPEIAALTDAYALVKCLARHDRSPGQPSRGSPSQGAPPLRAPWRFHRAREQSIPRPTSAPWPLQLPGFLRAAGPIHSKPWTTA